MSHRYDLWNIAVMLLLDLVASLKDIPQGCEQSIMLLCQEAVALPGWSIEIFGDSITIAGFSSNTRR